MRCSSERWVYLAVINKLKWPKIFCNSIKSTPASKNMFDFLDEFDLEDFVIGVNQIKDFEKDQKDERYEQYNGTSERR